MYTVLTVNLYSLILNLYSTSIRIGNNISYISINCSLITTIGTKTSIYEEI